MDFVYVHGFSVDMEHDFEEKLNGEKEDLTHNFAAREDRLEEMDAFLC